MRSKLWIIALLALANPACTLLPGRQPAVTPPPLPEAAPVTPNEVTPGNAYEKALELQRELNRDLEG
ncbi:MAG: hypothetical protein L0099_10660 [Acidobacteria bacterium]|nr:hypothetical protein [Acidobacteriota bacterium]